MEWKVGEINQVNGEWYQCLRTPNDYIGNICKLCSFQVGVNCISNYQCIGAKRKDNTNVFFKKLEKVGEPYVADSKCCQQYKCYTTPLHNRDIIYTFSDDIVVLEIKNKKDMEEKKIQISKRDFDYLGVKIRRDIVPLYTTHNELATDIMNLFTIVDDTKHSDSEKIGKNLKKFSLEAAKAGKPVCTRDGRKARIICFDFKNEDKTIVVAIGNDCFENLFCYTKNGKLTDGIESDKDLMMLPEKKEGWVNVYKVGARLETGGNVHSTKDAAIKCINSDKKHIATVKIEWEG